MTTFLRQLFCGLLLLLQTATAAPEAAIQRAALLASDGKSSEAADVLRTAIKENASASPELFFNLGVAEAQAKRPGHAFLAFDRTLQLNPFYQEAKQNIRALERLGTKRFTYQNGLWDELASLRSPSTWANWFWASIWLILASTAALCVKLTIRKWPWFVALSVGGVVAIATGLLKSQSASLTPASHISVIIQEDVTALNAPATTAATIISLPPGSQVKALSSVPGWTYIEVPGDRVARGWVAESVLEKLWPWGG